MLAGENIITLPHQNYKYSVEWTRSYIINCLEYYYDSHFVCVRCWLIGFETGFVSDGQIGYLYVVEVGYVNVAELYVFDDEMWFFLDEIVSVSEIGLQLAEVKFLFVAEVDFVAMVNYVIVIGSYLEASLCLNNLHNHKFTINIILIRYNYEAVWGMLIRTFQK